jgi:putative spermidine/putrescine transport system permease protein
VKQGRLFSNLLLLIVMLYLIFPLIATLLYAIANEWQNTILPKSWSLHWFQDLFTDVRFGASLQRTLIVCFVSVALNLLVLFPTIFIVVVYYPKWERVLNLIALLPYAIPGVVAAVGLIKLYSSGPLSISGTIWILIGAYFVTILPYMYQGIRNSLRTVRAVELMDAAELLGASKWQAFYKVIIPNVLSGITVSILLSFSILFGEFVLTNLLVGGQFETIQIYLYRRMTESGHLASAVVIVYFVLILLLSGFILKLSKWMFRTVKVR